MAKDCKIGAPLINLIKERKKIPFSFENPHYLGLNKSDTWERALVSVEKMPMRDGYCGWVKQPQLKAFSLQRYLDEIWLPRRMKY